MGCEDGLLVMDLALVAIDGSKFKAVSSPDKNLTPPKIKRCMEQINETFERYLKAMGPADRQGLRWRGRMEGPHRSPPRVVCRYSAIRCSLFGY
jgi:hypothetical protein